MSNVAWGSCLEAGNLKEASEHFSRSMGVAVAGTDKRGEALALWRQGEVDLALGDRVSAHARLTDALRRFQSAEMWNEVMGCLEDFAILARSQGLADEAVRFAAAVTMNRQRLGLTRRPAAEARWKSLLDDLRGPLGDERFVTAWNQAWDEWETDDAIQHALSLPETSERQPVQ